MSWKSFFTKQKKEELDQGLEKTKKSFFSKIATTVAGKSKVDDEVLDNLEEVLVSSDVSVKTTLKIIERLEQRVKKGKLENTLFCCFSDFLQICAVNVFFKSFAKCLT